MKKLSAIIIAMALVLGLSQCKKQDTPTNNNTEDGMVYITVNVDDDGTKHDVYPGTGAYVFANGDILYVGNNGHFVGTLEYQNGAFSGGITSPSTTDYLHFYFTGGKTPATNPTAGSTTSFTVDISDQSSKLPVLSYGHSTQKYTDANATYTTILKNQCGLVKFVPISETSKTIIVGGVKTTANINFATPGITPNDATGTVTLYSEKARSKWAILLPQDEVVYPDAKVYFDGVMGNVRYSFPAVTANMYYTTGVSIKEKWATQINANGDRVYFSQGNLQYIGSVWPAYPAYWKFADNQWDIMGTSQNLPVNPSSYRDCDLFGWGTSGWNSGANSNSPYYYSPTSYISTSNSGQNIGKNYGPGLNSLTGDYANADWGVYNPISNGGNVTNAWRTLTSAEWRYLLEDRPGASNLYGFGSVCGIEGLILNSGVILPDIPFTPGNSSWVNEYTLEQWQLLEDQGYIFLPAAGYRKDRFVSDANTNGYYWSASTGFENYAGRVKFTDGNLSSVDTYFRSWGYAVRLVRDVE